MLKIEPASSTKAVSTSFKKKFRVGMLQNGDKVLQMGTYSQRKDLQIDWEVPPMGAISEGW